MSCHVMLCHVMSCHVMSCHVMHTLRCTVVSQCPTEGLRCQQCTSYLAHRGSFLGVRTPSLTPLGSDAQLVLDPSQLSVVIVIVKSLSLLCSYWSFCIALFRSLSLLLLLLILLPSILLSLSPLFFFSRFIVPTFSPRGSLLFLSARLGYCDTASGREQ